VYTQFINVAAVRMIKRGGPRVGDSCSTVRYSVFIFKADIPLYDRIKTIFIAVNTTKFQCLLKQRVSAYVGRNMLL